MGESRRRRNILGIEAAAAAIATSATRDEIAPDPGVLTAEKLREAAGKPPRENPTDPALWGGRLNIYTCEKCRGHVLTRDVDKGVTPFMIPCMATDDCDAMMTSSFYRVWNQSTREDYQWRKPPTLDGLSRYHAEHVQKDGLLLYHMNGERVT